MMVYVYWLVPLVVLLAVVSKPASAPDDRPSVTIPKGVRLAILLLGPPALSYLHFTYGLPALIRGINPPAVPPVPAAAYRAYATPFLASVQLVFRAFVLVVLPFATGLVTVRQILRSRRGLGESRAAARLSFGAYLLLWGFVAARVCVPLVMGMERTEFYALRLSTWTALHPALVGFNMIIAGPICEEWYFRGVLWPVLEQRFRPVGVVIVSSTLFGLIHDPANHAIVAWTAPLFAGVLLGNLRLRGHSLVSCMAWHAVINVCSWHPNLTG